MGKKLSKLVETGEVSGVLFPGQWIKFEDANGVGFAQPDFFIVQNEEVWVFEVKLSQTHKAWGQMGKLYKPLLTHIYGKPVKCIQVCKHLKQNTPGIVSGWKVNEIVNGSTVHWIGG